MKPPAADRFRPLHLLDPCAGRGEALVRLRDAWTPTGQASTTEAYGCELERERANALGETLGRHRAHHGDAFHLRWDAPTLDLLYLNPPYDHDAVHRRSELRFLRRFTPALRPGRGGLLLLVPVYTLPVLAEHLARHYVEHHVYRLPDEHFADFQQVLLVARRAALPTVAPEVEARIRDWADPERLPVLPETCDDPLELPEPPPVDPYEPHDTFTETFRVRLLPLDVTSVLDQFRPWEGRGTGTDLDARRLLGARFHTATPPKPAHIALALSAGMFNGLQLQPNDPRRHPPVLAKGVFERQRVEVGQTTNKDGNVTGSIQVEQPRLRVELLRLDTYTYQTLAAGVVPNGGDDPAEWNAADLLVNYDRAFARLLHRQFPPLHNPADASQRLALPPSPRTPYRVQHDTISATLKLIATGQNPFLVAEVGTGKSTMGLFVALALSAKNRARTVAELERLGFPTDRLPTVRRTLIVCPPHLLKSWRDQAAAVIPGARVRILRKPSDLEGEYDIAVLSRETAKLGYRVGGLEGRCPGCGSKISTTAEKNARRRQRCSVVRRRPLDAMAWLAVRLAEVLILAATGKDDLAGQLAPSQHLKPYYDGSGGMDPASVRSLARQAIRLLDHHLGEVARGAESHAGLLADCIQDLLGLVRLDGAAESIDIFASRHLEFCRGLDDGNDRQALRNALHHCQRLTRWLRLTERPPRQSTVKQRLTHLLERLVEAGRFDTEPCGEPLFTATPSPRRYPLAKLIARYHRRRFDLVLLDEAHEYNNTRSAQTHAVHRLVGLPGMTTVVLTGSLMGGYASSLFANFYALSPRFRREFGRGEMRRFVERYGYQKVLVRTDDRSSKPLDRGAVTDREIGPVQRLGEAPGIVPTFLMQHLLPTSILVHKDDLDDALPPITEEPASLTVGDDPLDGELLAEYRRLRDKLLDRIRQDRFTPGLSGKLLGALVELPSYLDRCTADQGGFAIRYPASCGDAGDGVGPEIAVGRVFPSDYVAPKERWLLAELQRRIDAGENVLVFLRHTGNAALPSRLLRLIAERVTLSCKWLDTKKVAAAKREAWIDRQVNDAGVRVLLVNADAVRTGLNNLVSFTTAIWHELTWSATTYRQANGRIHRIGQTEPVSVHVPFYAGTAQETAFDLVARKVSASLQVDGLDIQAGLEAAGASDESANTMATALALGEAVYRAMTREAA